MPTPVQVRPRAGMAFSGRPQNNAFGKHSDLGNSVISFFQGAQDDLTFGLGDQAYAGIGALYDAAQGKSVGDSYRKRIAHEHARDRYYAAHNGTSRSAGKIAGSLAQLAVGGVPLGQLGKAGVRIKEVTPVIGRELARLAGTGGAGGVVSQGFSDVATHNRASPGNYIGAGIGGAVEGVLGLKGRPGRVSAIGGAVTSVAQDILNGRAPSLTRAAEAASAGGITGAAGGAAGRVHADGLSRAHKEKLGELASRARTWARGEKTISTAKDRVKLRGGGFTKPDQVTSSNQLVESKFGRSAALSKRQRQAYHQGDLNYRVDHALPGDVGSIYGYLAAKLGYHIGDDARHRGPQQR